jgi:hypothetical protein
MNTMHEEALGMERVRTYNEECRQAIGDAEAMLYFVAQVRGLVPEHISEPAHRSALRNLERVQARWR